MKPGPLAFCACVLAFALSAPSHAQRNKNGDDKAPAADLGYPQPPAPVIITRPNSQISTDPEETDAIENTIGRDPTPGASQAIHCPGGQTISEAEGDVRNVTCK